MENNIRILLIEDNPGDAFLIEEHLDEFAIFPYELIIAETLNEALSVLKEQSFDIILSDLSLPDSEGINTLFSIHNENLLIPIIVLSGSNDEITASYAIEKGAHDFFDKGKMENRLLDCIKQCVLS